MRFSASSLDGRVRNDIIHAVAAIFPLSAGTILYGWRGLGGCLLVMISSAGAFWVWRRIGARGAALRLSHTLYLAMLLSLVLPPHLLSTIQIGSLAHPWAILPSAGVLLVIFLWISGRRGPLLIHPVVLTYLSLLSIFGTALSCRYVLQRQFAFAGDLLNARPLPAGAAGLSDAWIRTGSEESTRDARRPAADETQLSDAIFWESAAPQRLAQYTRGLVIPSRQWATVGGLLREAMPPLEDLVVGGHPGPLGASSGIAIIIGGLFLLNRNRVDARLPLLVILAAYLSFLLLPIPSLIVHNQVQWHSLIITQTSWDWPTNITFANYELMASPLLFVCFFLAADSAIAPHSKKSKILYALVLGALAGASQLYLSPAWGPLLALIPAGWLARHLDSRAAFSAEQSENVK